MHLVLFNGNSNLTVKAILTVVIIAFSVGVFPAQTLPKASPETVGMSSNRLARLTAALDKYAKDERLAGGVAIVARRGKIVYTHVFGDRDREARSPMREDTIFRIASQSKLITSVGIMILQEEGRLLIADPVGNYLPEFKTTTVAVPKEGGGYDVVKAKRQITIRDLLTHTAGISYGTGPAKDKWEAAGITGFYTADLDEPIADTVKKIAALPMDAHPGEKYVYGYAHEILGALIEKVSGQDMQEFFRTRIYEPLGMNDTHFFLPEAKAGRFAAVYGAGPDGKITRAPDPGRSAGQGAYIKGPRKNYAGGAGILSTAGDYMRFLLMLQNGGELNGRRVLSRKSVELLSADHSRSIPFREGQGIGFGVSVTKDVGARGVLSSVGEYGWGGAYHSSYWIDPKEQLVVVYMSQLIPAGTIDDHGKLRSLVYQAIID
ncbi:MAG: serine hydrolase domain-containing protein [Pyrinomonadaceae bacterium]|nr:serine hydrolase domain-containing protein [Pyrinomonadaceae bacterium]